MKDKSVEIAGVNEEVKQSIVVLELASQDSSKELKLTSGMGVRHLGQWSMGWSLAQTQHL